MRTRHWLITAGLLVASAPACSEDTGDSNSGDAGNATGGAKPTNCTITATSSLSAAIATVGIVTFTTDLPDLSEASIEFGLTPDYGLTAPVKLTQPNYRTLLLGMKASRTYHYRVVARAGQRVCTGPDNTLTTGALPSGLPPITLTPPTAEGLAGGYLVGSLQPSFLVMIDADGDYVWAVEASGSRALMSYSGEHVWFLSTNQAGLSPNVRRIAIDGTGLEMHPEFGDAHHDLVVLPDETVGFLQYTGARDRLMERAPDGTVRDIIDVPAAHGGVTDNHSNSIHYFETEDSYTFSDLDQNCYVKVSRQGRVAWVLGGSTSDFTGPGATWTEQHGHHLLDPNRILFFVNGGSGENSLTREVTLDLTSMTATTTWSYDGDESSPILGDVQRLENGNTIVTYSYTGVMHEVSASGTLLQSLSVSNAGFGYMTKRQSLYGPPPKQTAMP
jgi:hypothetical protein